MAYTEAWDETYPPDSQLAKLLGDDIRKFKTDIRERVGTFLSGVAAARPTPEAEWAGLLYFATDTRVISRWDGAAWQDVMVGKFSNGVAVVPAVPGGGIELTLPLSTLNIGDVVDIHAAVEAVDGEVTLQIDGQNLVDVTLGVNGKLALESTLLVVAANKGVCSGDASSDQAASLAFNGVAASNIPFDITTPLIVRTFQASGTPGSHFMLTVTIR